MTDNDSQRSVSPSPNPSGPMTLYALSIGHFMSRAIALFAKLGIADLLAAEPRSAEALARATDTDALALGRVLRFVASAGVLEQDAQGLLRLSPIGEALRSDVAGSMHAMVSLFAGEAIQADWAELEYCVRTGQPAFKRRDPTADAFTAMQRDPQREAIFDRAMATFAPQTAAAIAAAYDFGQLESLVDVGGGNGALLAGILRAFPTLRGVLFDQPKVIERARAAAPLADVRDRMRCIGGSFFEAVPADHSAYLLKHVIHDWNDADATKILRACRTAMPAHARLLIVEGLYPAQIAASPDVQAATATDVNMLVCTGGRQRSEPEFQALLTGAGFTLNRIVPTRGRVSVLEALPQLKAC